MIAQRIDPTRSALLRRKAGTEINRWFAELKKDVWLTVVEQNDYGLGEAKSADVDPAFNAFCPTGPGGGIDNSCSPGQGGDTSVPFDVLDWYSGSDQTTGGHREVNAYLRGVKSTDPRAVHGEVSEQAKKVIQELDKAFEKSATVLDAPRTLYRGSYADLIKELGGVPDDYGGEWHTYPHPDMDLSKLKGKVVEDKGFMSTSTEAKYAKKFNDQVVLKLKAPAGTKVIDRGFRYEEGENLLPRGTKFKITGAKKIVDDEGNWRAEISATIVTNELATNAFCPTGEGGGIDNSCSPTPKGFYDKTTSTKAIKAMTSIVGKDLVNKLKKAGVQFVTVDRDDVNMRGGASYAKYQGKVLLSKEVSPSDVVHEVGHAVDAVAASNIPISERKFDEHKYWSEIHLKTTIAQDRKAAKPKKDAASWEDKTQAWLYAWSSPQEAFSHIFAEIHGNSDKSNGFSIRDVMPRTFDKVYQLVKSDIVTNAFCPTGPGGGIDNSCSPVTSVSSAVEIIKAAHGGEIEKAADSYVFRQMKSVEETMKAFDTVMSEEKTNDLTEAYRHEFERNLRNGMAFKSELPGGRWVTTQVTRQLRPGDVTTFAVRIDFGVEGRSDTSVGKYLEKESIMMLRKVKQLVAFFQSKGLPVEVQGSDKRRKEVYDKWMTKQGFKSKEERSKAIIYNEHQELDDVGLITSTSGYITDNANGRFKFRSTGEKLKEFVAYVGERYDARVNGKTQEAVLTRYVVTMHDKGLARSYSDATKKERALRGATKEKELMSRGGREEFLRRARVDPSIVDRVRVLASRTYMDIQGVTKQSSDKMRRILVDGMASGTNPREVGRKLMRELDLTKAQAVRIARTEMIRAHAEGQLDAFERMGRKTVRANVEFSATKLLDGSFESRVCPKCQDLDGEKYTIPKARGIIPVHPNCRCSWKPAEDEVVQELKKQPKPKRKLKSDAMKPIKPVRSTASESVQDELKKLTVEMFGRTLAPSEPGKTKLTPRRRPKPKPKKKVKTTAKGKAKKVIKKKVVKKPVKAKPKNRMTRNAEITDDLREFSRFVSEKESTIIPSGDLS